MSFFAQKSELALVFDVASSSVSVTLIRLAVGEPVRIIHSLSESLTHQKSVDPERLFKDMLDALRRVHENIIKQSLSKLAGTEFRHVKINRVFYSFASPWSTTQTKTLSIKKDKPFSFTHDFLNNLMLEEEKVFSEDLSVIERRIIQTKLNGYDVNNPFGQSINQVDVSYFTGIVPKSILEKTSEISHTAHISKNIKNFTFPLIAYSFIKNTFPNERDFIQLRIGGEISDVSIVEDGLITGTASFPRGYRNILSDVAVESSMVESEAVSFLKMMANNHMDHTSNDKLNPIFSRFVGEWVSDLQNLLKKMNNDDHLPRKLFLTTDFEPRDFFIRAVENTMPTIEVVAIDPPIILTVLFAERVYETEKK